MKSLFNSMSRIAYMAADESGSGAAVDPAAAPAPAPITKLKIIDDATQIEALTKVLPSNRVYDTYAAALEALTKAAKEIPADEVFVKSEGAEGTGPLYGLPMAVVGLDDETNEVDESIYTGMRVRLGTLAARVDAGNGKTRNGIKAITILPIPTLESIMGAGTDGAEFLNKIIAKEFGAVAYRNIRDANTTAELISGMAQSPKTVAEYLTESKRAGSAGDTETFDAIWIPLRNSLKKAYPGVAKLLPSKVDVIKSIRSKSFALADEERAQLENAAAGSVFVRLAKAAIATAATNTTKDGQPNPLDSSAIADWLTTRDTLELGKREEKDFTILQDIDFGTFGGDAPAAE